MISFAPNSTGDYLLHRFCDPNTSASVDKYVGNVTASYTDTSNESSMVAASVIMFALAGIFFNLNLFSRFSDVSAILDPKVRIFLSSLLSLFLPVMSYLLSEAKNAGKVAAAAGVGRREEPDLSLQAGLILLWMLLVELLRKKVDEIRMRGYSGTIQRAGRVVWLGSLVFFNLKRVGRKAVFGIFWVLCATKVVQRIAFTEVGKRSYAHGKNTRLITSYMSQILQPGRPQPQAQQDHQQHYSPSAHVLDVEDVEHRAAAGNNQGGGGEAMLKRCKFIVMGEEDLVIEPTADGYKLKDISPNDTVLTVGKIWDHAYSNLEEPLRLRLRRLCFSFALFKLLRRRFEHLPPVTKEETRECRDLLFDGVYHDRSEKAAAELFQMMNDEVNFLCEYYHSVIPVVLASPFFLLANYFLLPVVVLGLCVMTVVLCGFGDAGFAFASITTDNFAIKSGIVNTTMCLLVKSISNPSAFFTTVDFAITFLLLAIFFYEEMWEFIVFLLSNWFMVSLIHSYVTKQSWRKSQMFTSFVHRILWLRKKLSQPVLGFKQFSLLNLRWPLVLGLPSMFSLVLETAPVPKGAKHAIMESLVKHIHDGTDLNNGSSVLVNREDLLPACRSDSLAEVILTWHVATSIMEAKYSPNKGKQSKASQYHMVATRLSKYCAYLVAFHPELLPDNQEKSEHVFEAAKEELKATLKCAPYYLLCWRSRVDKVMAAPNREATAAWEDGKVVHNGTKLGNMLREEPTGDRDTQREQTWKLLADVWTELLVYLAPSSDEERVMGHESVLVQGGEFITVLWALTTHTGITRPEK
ncbi:hypothetical protein CFC21_055219 [Triticum aestivum]|uniref:DUF4220 domain-containing protein n=2 Tax=Triticum aestivum TaxID=4565 RepID=A0A9R1GFP3_WHEAT|nr:uncharacterized protein LOC123088294 [Triticum aestivum]KAF7046168.1 hypothetical protein CFC21_055219 [Triticum aestivum]